MGRIRALAATLLITTSAAQADTLGIELGGYNWKQAFSGEVSSGLAGTQVDVEDDLGYDDETSNVIFIALEHPIPILPNIRLQQTDLDLSATGNSSFTFEGFNYNGPVHSEIDMSHTDVTLYYELLDNWISLDLGLTARVVEDGLVRITDLTTSQTESFEIDGVIPLLYVATKLDLPLSGLYIGADASAISVSDDSIIDYRARIGYESSIGLGVEAGFRSFEIDVEDDEDTADLTVDGTYISIFFSF